MDINKKLLQYLEFKGVSQRKFSFETGLSDGLLRKGKSISTDKLAIVRNKFPDINWDWVLFDEGEMILEEESTPMIANENGVQYENCCKNCDHLEELLEAKNETIAILKHQLGINGGNNNSKAS